SRRCRRGLPREHHHPPSRLNCRKRQCHHKSRGHCASLNHPTRRQPPFRNKDSLSLERPRRHSRYTRHYIVRSQLPRLPANPPSPPKRRHHIHKKRRRMFCARFLVENPQHLVRKLAPELLGMRIQHPPVHSPTPRFPQQRFAPQGFAHHALLGF